MFQVSTFVAAPCENSEIHPRLEKINCWQGQCMLEFIFPSMNCVWWILRCSKVATEIDIIVFFLFVDWYVWCRPVKSVPGLSACAGRKTSIPCQSCAPVKISPSESQCRFGRFVHIAAILSQPSWWYLLPMWPMPPVAASRNWAPDWNRLKLEATINPSHKPWKLYQTLPMDQVIFQPRSGLAASNFPAPSQRKKWKGPTVIPLSPVLHSNVHPCPTSKFSFSHSSRFDSTKLRSFTENGVVFSSTTNPSCQQHIMCVFMRASHSQCTSRLMSASCPARAMFPIPIVRLTLPSWSRHTLCGSFRRLRWTKQNKQNIEMKNFKRYVNSAVLTKRLTSSELAFQERKLSNIEAKDSKTAQTIKYQMSFPDAANRCRMSFPNCNKHTKFCAYWNTQPHWGELDRHLIAWPDKGKHSQRKHYTPEKKKIASSLVKEMTEIQWEQHVLVCRNLYRLPRPALDPVGRNGTHAASIWFVGCLGR